MVLKLLNASGCTKQLLVAVRLRPSTQLCVGIAHAQPLGSPGQCHTAPDCHTAKHNTLHSSSALMQCRGNAMLVARIHAPTGKPRLLGHMPTCLWVGACDAAGAPVTQPAVIDGHRLHCDIGCICQVGLGLLHHAGVCPHGHGLKLADGLGHCCILALGGQGVLTPQVL